MVQKCASLFLVRVLWVHSNRKGYRDRMEEKKLEKNVIEDLIHQAFEAQAKAYVPYSQFAVGAALLARGGRIYQGVILRMHPTPRPIVQNVLHFSKQYLRVSQNLMPLPL